MLHSTLQFSEYIYVPLRITYVSNLVYHCVFVGFKYVNDFNGIFITCIMCLLLSGQLVMQCKQCFKKQNKAKIVLVLIVANT